MPGLGKFGGASARGFGQIIRKAGGAPYWINFHGSNASIERFRDVAFDALGNVYAVGTTNNGGTYDIYMTKFNSLGANQWQIIQNSNQEDVATSVAVDSVGDVYVCGVRTVSAENGRFCWQINKINSTTGVVTWQTVIGGNKGDAAYRLALDSSDNLYVLGIGGFQPFQTNAGANLIKINSSTGAVVWQKNYGGASGVSTGGYMGLDIDSSGNPHIFFMTGGLGIIYGDYQIVKCNSSGDIIWQRTLATPSDELLSIGDLCVDPSGNVYVAGRTIVNVPDPGSGVIAKYDSSGNFQWVKALQQSDTWITSVRSDTSGNIYITGGGYVMKLDGAGNIIWQRTLSFGGGGGLKIDSTKNTYYVGGSVYTSDNVQASISKLPADGSLTGTYSINGTNWTYGTGSYTFNTPSSFTSSNASITTATATIIVGTVAGVGSFSNSFITTNKTL